MRVPKVTQMAANTPQILNAVRNGASADYKNAVPACVMNGENIQEIGKILLTNTPLMNEFLPNLVNRIGLVIIRWREYTNPWSFLRKGELEMGETIERLFPNLITVENYNPETAETTVFKRRKPEVKSEIYIVNYRKMYPLTIQEESIKFAFISMTSVADLISMLMAEMYVSMEYDEYLTLKYLLGRQTLNGLIFAKGVDVSNPSSVVKTVKEISNDMQFMKTKYNAGGRHTKTTTDFQYLFISTKFDAEMSVDVLATAFNMSKADFLGRRILIDSFVDNDDDRLALLFKDDNSYTPFTEQEKITLDSIPLWLVDREFIQLYDKLTTFTEPLKNPAGLYTQYFLHAWRAFATSIYENAVVFSPAVPSITSVTVSPKTATVTKGQSISMGVTVISENFASKQVAWTITGNTDEKTYISYNGVLYVSPDETGTSIVVTATSLVDKTKKDTATITVA